MYGYVRSRQIEETTGEGPKRGVYLLTAQRISAGWGIVNETRWPYDGRRWPPVFPFGACKLDRIASFSRIAGYHAIRDLGEGKALLAEGWPFQLTVPVTAAWKNPPGGRIPMPWSSTANAFGEVHAIEIIGFNDAERTLLFRNSWGARWGDKGYGYLPYLYAALHSIEAWAPIPYADDRPVLPDNDFAVLRSDLTDPSDHHRIFLSLYGHAGRKLGWCFATLRDGYLEIEEFFVKPAQQIKGIAMLVPAVLRLVEQVGLPARVWISHCDAGTRYNRRALDAVIYALGLRQRPTLARWAHRVAD